MGQEERETAGCKLGVIGTSQVMKGFSNYSKEFIFYPVVVGGN